MADTIDAEDRKTIKEFHEAVNMTPAALEKWLDSPESKDVGWKGEDGKGSGESVGHQSGEKIVKLLHKKQADLTADDLAHMKKVVGYVHRHMAQKPKDPEGSKWEASLKNWGHDPAKK